LRQFIKLITLCVVQAFGWFALFAYVVDLTFAIHGYRKARVSRRETMAYHESSTTTTTTTSARY